MQTTQGWTIDNMKLPSPVGLSYTRNFAWINSDVTAPNRITAVNAIVLIVRSMFDVFRK